MPTLPELPGGWFFPGDIETYRSMYQQIPIGGVACEVGTYRGRSLCSVADLVLERQITVHVVDTFGDPLHGDGQPESLAPFMRAIECFGIRDSVKVYACRSDIGAQRFEPQSFDLIFIDADHNYKAAKSDLINYLPLLKPGGIFAGHDYPAPGVKRALYECFSDVISKPSMIWQVKL